MADTVLEIQNVSKVIRGNTLVHPFNLQMETGQVLALCGGNGAGKSTILRMIAGILQPTSGTIKVCGVEWKRNRKTFAQKIGYMPDDFQFGQGLSAKETLYFYAGLRGVKKAIADQTLETVGLWEARDKLVSRFSKGMRQRLLFAQALLAKPALLILDEPTNGLDPHWMQSFISLVKDVKEANKSVIFSTHHLNVAEEAADGVVFLNNGRIVSTGTLSKYKEVYGERGLSGAFSELIAVP